MHGFEQLNIYGLANLKSKVPQYVHLFAYDEFTAQLIVVPSGTTVEWHEHTHSDEVLDVIEGEGTFGVGDRQFCGGPGKSVYVKAGVRHLLRNDSRSVWVVRSTCREQVRPRDIGKILRRAIRSRLNLDT
jgi:mannose-6-phosphate isomerase-like protein (cupin superfamily)